MAKKASGWPVVVKGSQNIGRLLGRDWSFVVVNETDNDDPPDIYELGVDEFYVNLQFSNKVEADEHVEWHLCQAEPQTQVAVQAIWDKLSKTRQRECWSDWQLYFPWLKINPSFARDEELARAKSLRAELRDAKAREAKAIARRQEIEREIAELDTKGSDKP